MQACMLLVFHSGMSSNIELTCNQLFSAREGNSTPNGLWCLLVALLPVVPCCLSSNGESMSTRLHLPAMMGQSVVERPVTTSVQSLSQQGNQADMSQRPATLACRGYVKVNGAA